MKVQNFYPSKNFSAQVQSLRRFIHEALGWNYEGSVGAPAILMPLTAVGIITSLTGRFDFRGRVRGHAFANQSFELADVTAGKMEQSSLGNLRNMRRLEDMNQIMGELIGAEDMAAMDATFSERRGFQGVVISLPHHSPFMGRTIIRRDMGKLNPPVVQDLKRVGFASSVFETKFEVFSDDQVEARFLITPDFMERLITFSDDYLGRNVQCAFLGDKFHVTVDIDDRFDFSRDLMAANYQDASTSIINEIGGIFYLLEKLQTLQARVGAKGSETVDKERGAYYKGVMDNLIPAVKGAADKFDPADPALKDMQHVLPFFCESLHGMLMPRF